MNCEEARDRLTELSRRAGAPDSDAEGHASACADCAEWLAAQRSIRAGLRGLSDTMGAPRPELEAALLVRFRQAQQKPRQAWWAWAAAAALAIGIGLGAWFARERPVERAAIAPPQEVERAGEFLQLDYGRPLPGLTAGRLVRVTLPPTAPAWFGLPVDPTAREGIEAEVLLGDDGVAQAVRLIHTSGR